MDCKEVQEKISPFIDGEISQSEKQALEKHILICNSCFFDFRIESFIKKLVSLKYKREEVPELLTRKIINQIQFERKSKKSFLYYLTNVFKSYRVGIAWAMVIMIASLILINRVFLQPTAVKEEQPSKMVEIILLNYQKIKSNQFPQSSVFSSNTSDVLKFIQDHGFPNPVLPETDWKLIGAGIEKLESMNIVHFLYECNNDDIYVMEMDVNQFKQKNKSVVLNSLFEQMKNNKYIIIGRDSCKVVVTLKGATLVSHVIRHENKEAFDELIAALE